ncbi:WecB/TagA/CpsF family glycosyltransferase [Desertifilum sp. FACHB-1129]|uniref:Glycosyl transferase n=2 Tax=Desertifilum tharense IPPAS B-1220 TaxID=1781255 RepID=A0A1E5QKP2_9CYAN|nr:MULTISPECIES: WecB/TagA/CpsF family glycosyltransferase [Desertifilum]MDA0210236.1 WecB/TagA/CpsF family glycosyltransferase [Cyanobacteria bacterium FC1]MBD2310182.1 WecB/TagA/CpsF family glycosyltransferase [Desertifilum sp. FACHB-1129]MBD2322558.1 WecB/TagA/CpsF family glycosyltransferase [Desertifilum sp. FACHB-866]MBD2334611.1 WecB/TagA/CpsF family glycosyltransferase [Desertifilum sp. FACHB-868]OEJ75249.1 glycosyl transferase [Desertifilum tharense IPPAS B-1220]
MKSVRILNVSINNLSTKELLAQLKTGVVFTPNVDHLVKLQKDSEFVQVYQTADYRVCDSKILYYVSRFLGCPVKEKISGSDLFPAFYEYHRDNEEMKIFLLGGKEGVAKRAQANINAKLGREMVIDAHSPSFGFEENEAECDEIIDIINRSGATVLGVGVGAPKQEKWIAKHKHRMPNVKIFLAIGATIDFEAGNIKRAPKWMSEVGMEWLYRLVSEPARLWKRYLVEDTRFFWLVLKQKMNLYQVPYEPIGASLQHE